jgi:subtilisin family serine protease
MTSNIIIPRWDLNSIDTKAASFDSSAIKAFHSWDNSTSWENDGLTLAVVGSGVDHNHPVFEGIEVEQVNLTGKNVSQRDALGHETAVAGLIVELCPFITKILDLRVFSSEGKTSLDILLRAYQKLLDRANQIDLANISLGSKQDVPELNARHNQLVSKGVLTFVSAGNTGDDGGSPATAKKAFSVGALTNANEMTDFSSFDPEHDNPDICALGKNVRLPRAQGTSMGQVIDDMTVMASGTSFSCPIMTAAAGCYIAKYGTFSRKDFERTAQEVAENPRDGKGKLNLTKAIWLGEEKRVTETGMYAQVYGDNNNLIWLDYAWLDSGRYQVGLKGNSLEILESED